MPIKEIEYAQASIAATWTDWDIQKALGYIDVTAFRAQHADAAREILRAMMERIDKAVATTGEREEEPHANNDR